MCQQQSASTPSEWPRIRRLFSLCDGEEGILAHYRLQLEMSSQVFHLHESCEKWEIGGDLKKNAQLSQCCYETDLLLSLMPKKRRILLDALQTTKTFIGKLKTKIETAAIDKNLAKKSGGLVDSLKKLSPVDESPITPLDKCERCGRPPHWEGECHARTTVDGRNLQPVCHHCERKGHWQDDCHARSSADGLRLLPLCHRCKRFGHRQSRCYAETTVGGRDIYDNNQGECYRCGRSDHHVDDCTEYCTIDGNSFD
eukprot:m.184738 g.184738  ORF g.184738 m.184738 type:complete len:255 (+) comp39332_c1_seq18:1170-1934(+)